MSPKLCCKWHYLDASAIVKLYADEAGSSALHRFRNANTNFCTTPICLAEALCAFSKKRTHEEMSVEQYFSAVCRLLTDAWGKRIEIDDIAYVNAVVQAEVETTAKKHSLDISDALLLVTILKGPRSNAELGSRSVLITANRNLAIAAGSEDVRVWNCIDGSMPSWD